MESVKKFYGWKLVAALWVQYFMNMGLPLYGGTVISSLMLNEIKMPRSTYGLAFTLLNLFIGVSSVFVSVSIVKWGVKITFIIGSTLIMIGALFMGLFASTPWHFLLGVGVIIGTGIGFGTVIPISTTVSRWFTRLRGRAMAIALTAPALAGLLFAPMTNWLIQNAGLTWRQAWLCVACIMVLSMITAYIFIKEKPEDLGQLPDGGAPKESSVPKGILNNTLRTSHEWTPKQAYKTLSYWVILIGACVTQFPFFFFTAHWILAMKGIGFSPEIAAISMGIFTVMGVPARLIAGFFMDKISARYVFMIGFLCYIVAYVLAITITSQTLMLAYIVACLTAFGFGMSFIALQTVIANYYGHKAYSRINGNICMISGVISCPAPIIAGKLFDMAQSYTPAFKLNIAIGVIGIVAVVFLKMPLAINLKNSTTVNNGEEIKQ